MVKKTLNSKTWLFALSKQSVRDIKRIWLDDHLNVVSYSAQKNTIKSREKNTQSNTTITCCSQIHCFTNSDAWRHGCEQVISCPTLLSFETYHNPKQIGPCRTLVVMWASEHEASHVSRFQLVNMIFINININIHLYIKISKKQIGCIIIYIKYIIPIFCNI